MLANCTVRSCSRLHCPYAKRRMPTSSRQGTSHGGLRQPKLHETTKDGPCPGPGTGCLYCTRTSARWPARTLVPLNMSPRCWDVTPWLAPWEHLPLRNLPYARRCLTPNKGLLSEYAPTAPDSELMYRQKRGSQCRNRSPREMRLLAGLTHHRSSSAAGTDGCGRHG